MSSTSTRPATRPTWTPSTSRGWSSRRPSPSCWPRASASSTRRSATTGAASRGMKLSNEFTVPAPVDRAWDVLLDLERVAPCLPGARLEGGDGRDFEGQMSIKIGPVTTRYKGTVRIEEAAADARRAVMRAQARDARAAGTAAATIATVMRPVDEGTLVAVETDIQISGPAAQFGRGVMQEVSSKLMARFAECLAEEMGADAAPAPAMGTNEATPADAASGRTTTTGATPVTVDWAAAAI